MDKEDRYVDAYVIPVPKSKVDAYKIFSRKIGDFALFAVGLCVAVPLAACVAYFVGTFVLWPISLLNEDFTDSASGFGPAFGRVKVPVIVIAIGCLAIWVGVRVANSPTDIASLLAALNVPRDY